MITINDLSFSYNKHNSVFERLNMEMKPGCIYGLLGENGVGKTTLLRLLCGLRFPERGTIHVHQYEPRNRQAEFLQDVYYMPEVIEAVAMSIKDFASATSPFYPRFSQSDFENYLQEFNIDPLKKLSQSSHGQQKKAMMCFALACNTQLLLLDEPTNGMDIPSKGIFRRLIARAASDEKCFVISTHQVRDLENLIDPIIILENNQVLLNNTIEEITGKLWFGIQSEKRDADLYREEAIGGYSVVRLNEDREDTKVNIEMLFNAAIENKEMFKRLFNPKKVSSLQTQKEEQTQEDKQTQE